LTRSPALAFSADQPAASALATLRRELAARGVSGAALEARCLVEAACGFDRANLVAQGHGPLGEAAPRLAALTARRFAGEPLARILGAREFWGLAFQLSVATLVPRPETETLVERALALAKGCERPRILDVGVGSGAIALALKDERPDAQVTGVDVSADALALARENADRLGIEIELRQGDGALAAAEGWDVVVANPPYVESRVDVQPELRWEPAVALLGSGEHERLARAARSRFIAFEVGDGQASEVAGMLERLGYADVAITADLTGRDRVVEGRRP